MRNLFFYTRTEGDQEFLESFNVNKVVTTMQKTSGELVIGLDDFYLRPFEVPAINPKTGNPTGKTVIRKEMAQTVITIKGDDILRFKNLTELI